MPEPTTQQEREAEAKRLDLYKLADNLRQEMDWTRSEYDTFVACVDLYLARSLPPTDAPRVRELQAKYNELLFAVARKHAGESRHETALRYIRNAEAPTKEVAALARHQGESNG